MIAEFKLIPGLNNLFDKLICLVLLFINTGTFADGAGRALSLLLLLDLGSGALPTNVILFRKVST